MDAKNSLTDLVGQPWEKWIELLGRDHPLDDEDFNQASSPKPKPLAECKRLPSEDMMLFGFCPEVDPFVGVVCEYCENLVKPQFFREHIALRHSECVKLKVKVKDGREDLKVLNNVTSKSRKHAINNSVQKDEAPIIIEKKMESTKVQNSNNTEKNATVSVPTPTIPVSIPVSSVISKPAEATTVTADQSLPKPAPPAESDDTVSSTTDILLPVVPSTPAVEVVTIAPETTPVVNNRPPVKKLKDDTDDGVFLRPPDIDELAARKKRKAPLAKEKLYNPDIHCGVWNEQTKKNCLRALTCRTHSLVLKRAVPSRSKLFDVLLAEHRASNKAKKEKEDNSPAFIETKAPVEATPNLVPPFNEVIKPQINPQPEELSLTVIGSVSKRAYSWRVPDIIVPVTLKPSNHFLQTSFNHLEATLPGSNLPAEPTRAPHLKSIFPKPPSLASSVLKSESISGGLGDNLFTYIHAKPLSVCSIGLHCDGGYVGPRRQVAMLRRTVKGAFDDSGTGGAIRTDIYGFPLPNGPFHSNIKTVLSNICGRAAQRTINQRNAKLAHAAAKNAAASAAKNNALHSKASSVGGVAARTLGNLVSKNSLATTTVRNNSLLNTAVKTSSIGSANARNTSVANVATKNSSLGKNVPKNTTLVFKTFPVSAQAPINKDASKITSVHAITFVGPGTTKGQPKGLKRLSGESFKENDIIKSPRRSNPLLNSTELFTKTSQQGGTSLLRTERSEHCAGESLLVSNRTAVGFLTARPHSSVGDTLPQVPTGITPNSVASAAADKPQEALCTTKAKGSLIRLSSDGKITKGKISSQSMTCFASGQTMMLHPVLGPQVITMAPKPGSTNVKFIPQGPVGLTNTKTFLVKKDHGET